MTKRCVIQLMVGIVMVLVGCSGSDTPTGNPTGGTGGDQDGTAGTPNGAGAGGDQDVGGTGGTDTTPSSACPSGLECTSPAGEFVCTLATTLVPPGCVNQSDCSFGSCTQYQGASYCTKACGPAPVDECPGNTMCGSFYEDVYVCENLPLEGSPPCSTQADCTFGECITSYGGQKYCLQPCRPQPCTSGTTCTPSWGKFYCAQPSTALPDSCDTQNDTCQYGKCVNLEGEGYCTQECEPELVASCPGGTVCRAIAPFGFLCSDEATALPPECQSQADCAFGTCIKAGDTGYCTEYCAQPGIDVTGSIYGLQGALSGVEVCIFDNGTQNRDYCTTTDSSGLFALYGLPESAYFVLSMTKAGYQSNLQLAIANVPTASVMYTEQEISEAAALLGESLEANTGLIVFSALDANALGVSGYTAAISPQSGVGPFYAAADGYLAQSETASSASGWGAFFNLAPGNYTLEFTHSSSSCENLPEIIVVGGFLTYVVTGCF